MPLPESRMLSAKASTDLTHPVMQRSIQRKHRRNKASSNCLLLNHNMEVHMQTHEVWFKVQRLHFRATCEFKPGLRLVGFHAFSDILLRSEDFVDVFQVCYAL